MAIFALITNNKKEATLKQVLSIEYLVQFCQKNDKNKVNKVKALINSGNEISIIYLIYATKWGLQNRKIDISIHKIDGSYLNIIEIVIVDYLVKNKVEKIWFF